MILPAQLISSMYKFDLEERLVTFSVEVLEIVNFIKRDINGINLAKQLSRSAASASLHYGEAQASESRRDFIHKMKVVLKELRETRIGLKLLDKTKLYKNQTHLETIKQESLELILIFLKSIDTASNNLR